MKIEFVKDGARYTATLEGCVWRQEYGACTIQGYISTIPLGLLREFKQNPFGIYQIGFPGRKLTSYRIVRLAVGGFQGVLDLYGIEVTGPYQLPLL